MATFHVRRLPHYHSIDRPVFITWRLAGSLPANRTFPPANTSGKAFLTMDRLLDTASSGPLYLRRPEIASMVVEAIRYHDHGLGHYRLHGYAVMANHVHLLVSPRVRVSRLMQSLKRFTAREGNRSLGRTGRPFWQDESYDRLVRDEAEYERILRYIELNTVNAGLAARPEDFPWSAPAPLSGRSGVTGQKGPGWRPAAPIDNRRAGYQPAPQAAGGRGLQLCPSCGSNGRQDRPKRADIPPTAELYGRSVVPVTFFTPMDNVLKHKRVVNLALRIQ